MAGFSQVVATVEAYGDERSPQLASSPLRLLRAINGLSATRLAVLADVDRSTIWRLEEGIGRPQRRTAEKLAAVLNCPAELLFPESEERPAGSPSALQMPAGQGRHASG